MATPEEIRRRVETADTARSTRRADTAQKIAELAQQRAQIVQQLGEVDRALAAVLAEAQDVMDIDELAEFTDLKPADLNQWLGRRRSGRGKRTKTASERGDARRPSSGARSPIPEQSPTRHDGRSSTALAGVAGE
ncbi:hypothetical protein [Saccharothrix sp.]|uniref:hypothetical protein n=1 Tax=Saccharothrix sp. TaxID=1873460 RepID=UPI002811A037|nr:hypothetical protein [Saccharothrix sp.]